MKGSPAIHYDDFVPKSEWNEEPEANLLLVHLPGFAREQIRVTYVHSSKSLRITGERQLERDAKQWSRFNKVFPVPQNCLVEKIHGNFKDNILTVNMPKQTITRIPNTTTITSTTNTSTLKETRKESPKKTQETSSNMLTQEKKDGNEKVLPPGGTQAPSMSATTVKKIDSKEGRGVLDDHRGEQKDEKFTYSAGQAPPEPATTTKTTETKKVVEESSPGHVSRVQNGIENAKSVDPLGSDQNIQRQPAFPGIEGDKARARRATKNDVEKKQKGMLDLAMDTVKKFRGLEMSEEKKLMVNVGVAALVIFALGAYVSYTFTSSSTSLSAGKARE